MLIEALDPSASININGKECSEIMHLKINELLSLGSKQFVILEHLGVAIVDRNDTKISPKSLNFHPEEESSPTRLPLMTFGFQILIILVLSFFLAKPRQAEQTKTRVRDVSNSVPKKVSAVPLQFNKTPEISQNTVLPAKSEVSDEVKIPSSSQDEQVKKESLKSDLNSSYHDKKFRKEFDEIVLEGRFDPSQARVKLENLEKRLPPNHQLMIGIAHKKEQWQ